jgi:autotransporter passenger strand-loop-strand repeat protein
METYFAPPDRFDLVLNSGDTLVIDDDGHAYNTTINSGGVENVRDGGLTNHTTIHSGGVLNVNDGAGASETTIAGGVENVYAGAFDQSSTINSGGILNVHGGGVGETTINSGGEEIVYDGGIGFATINSGGRVIVDGGTADGVTFGGPQAKLELANPSGLVGTISNWHVGDVIDFLNTAATSVQENAAHTTLTVTYGTNETASYSLAGQQANTEFKLQSDGHGGTDLILIGVASPHPLIGFASPHQFV